MAGIEKCNCGHDVPLKHDALTGLCSICGCQRGDVLPSDGERLVFGVHRMRDVEARTAPAWDPSGPTVEQRRRAIDRVLRHE